MTSVSVGGLTFADEGFTDEFGCRWFLTDLSGWNDSPGVRGNPQERPGADGTWDANPTLDARVVAVSGAVQAPDEGLMLAAKDRVGAVLSRADRFGPVVVDEPSAGLSRQAVVRLGGPTLTARIGCTATFSLSLYAADPRRYSTGLHTADTARYQPAGGFSFPFSFPLDFGGIGSGGRLRVFNAGEVATPCRVLWFGDLVNPRVTAVEQNRTVAARIALALGQTLVVDSAVPSVLLGTSSRRQTLSSAQFFLLPPGWSTLFFDADSGAGSMRVEWRDAW